VVISEGEKCVNAVKTFKTYSSATWIGGSSAIKKTNFTPLKGRDVVILPDNDEAGTKATADLVATLQEVGAKNIRVVDIVRTATDCGAEPVTGFDIADAIVNGLTEEQFEIILQQTPTIVMGETISEVSTDPILEKIRERFGFVPDIPECFSLTEHGIIKHSYNQRGAPVDIFAGSLAFVTGRTRTGQEGHGWGYQIAVLSPVGEWETVIVPAQCFAGDGREVREMLAKVGFVIPQGPAGLIRTSELFPKQFHC
jgi:putative DNA primase/helicase